jgi:NADPH:quinone reductase-like Zn-dependent oxidoreductase
VTASGADTESAGQLAEVVGLYDAGAPRTTVGRSFPFAEFHQGVDYFRSGKSEGRVVVEAN